MFITQPLDDATRDQLRLASAGLDAAERSGQPQQMTLALAQLSRGYRALNALAHAESHLADALKWSRACPSVDQTVDLLCELSELAASLAEALKSLSSSRCHAARERARDHAFEASALAAHVTDPAWEIQVLLRVSDVLDRCGDHDDAVQMQARALRLMGQGDNVDTPAHVLPALNRLADA